MKKCKKCKREFDPSMEFVEDVELLEVVNRYIDTDNICPECIEEIDEKICTFVFNYYLKKV